MLDDRSWRYSIFKWLFQTTIDFTEDPPTKPPEIKFKTKVYHLNIRCDGNVCLKSNNEFTEGEKFIKVFYEIYYLFIKQNPANTWPAFKRERNYMNLIEKNSIGLQVNGQKNMLLQNYRMIFIIQKNKYIEFNVYFPIISMFEYFI